MQTLNTVGAVLLVKALWQNNYLLKTIAALELISA